MVLVSYSDSEGSDVESTPAPPAKYTSTQPSEPAPAAHRTNFAVDKSNPKKIRINLTDSLPSRPSTDNHDGEPPAKRPRVGAGVFAGFNAMLPAPKRDTTTNNPAGTNGTGSRPPARKVFSLKTGAEPAFSREADHELRELFTDDGGRVADDTGIPNSIPKPAFIEEGKGTPTSGSASGAVTGKPIMFKPLSVARNTKKKKTASAIGTPASSKPHTASIDSHSAPQKPPDSKEASTVPPTQKEKINLFSSGPTTLPPDPDEPSADGAEGNYEEEEEEDEIIELLDEDTPYHPAQPPPTTLYQSESLSSIASTLNLSAAERRQLLGRGKNTASAGHIINFNTDAEYIANQELNAAGEQVQHNPVRAIAPGKHSLKSLVASAQGQKDALQESFASGRKNKKEAGSKYGW